MKQPSSLEAGKLALLTFLSLLMPLPVGIFLFFVEQYVPGVFTPPDWVRALPLQAALVYERSGPPLTMVAFILVAAWAMGLLRAGRAVAAQAVAIAVLGPLVGYLLDYDMRILPLASIVLPWIILYGNRKRNPGPPAPDQSF